MKGKILALGIAIGSGGPAFALRLPPGGTCPPNAFCTQSPQLLTIPAFFDLDTRTDPTKALDWVRIQNAGSWVKLIVAGDIFENAATASQDLHNAPTTQTTFGYVYTGHGSIPSASVLNEVNIWYSHYAPSYVRGVFFDVGPTFDPGQIPGVTSAYENTTIQNAFGIPNYSFPGFEAYYEGLYGTVHSTKSWGVMLNAAQWPNDWILSLSNGGPASDYAILWEDTIGNYYDHWGSMACGTMQSTESCLGNVTSPPPAWWASPTYTAGYQVAHILFSANQFQVANAVQYSWNPDPAANRTASLFYLHDRPTAVYDGVACYFEQEIEALGGSTPTGGSTWCGL